MQKQSPKTCVDHQVDIGTDGKLILLVTCLYKPMKIERRFGKHGSKDNHTELGNKKVSVTINKHDGHGCKDDNGDQRKMLKLVTDVPK